jgi:hypothetical protein
LVRESVKSVKTRLKPPSWAGSAAIIRWRPDYYSTA